jgi:hypothetical protein
MTSMREGGLSASYESNTGKAETLIREYLSGEETAKGVRLFYYGN